VSARKLATLVVLLTVGLHVPPALAAEGGDHGNAGWMLALQALNAGILVLILVRFARKPLQNFMVQRRHEIQSSIQDAQARLDTAETDLARWRGRLSEIDEEAAEMVRGAEEQAESERRRSLERAEATSQRIREEAQLVAEQEIARARVILRQEAAELATQLAADMVRRNLSPDDDRRLVSEAAQAIARQNGGSA
jgi:F-type H+-transporting ATPase subunit b